MAEEVPRYITKLLDELGWNEGLRIPLADAENQILEDLLVTRQRELEKLKLGLSTQKQNQDDLDQYKKILKTESQENTRLLFSHKNQLEQEVKLRQLALIEASDADRDLASVTKQVKETDARVEKLQSKKEREKHLFDTHSQFQREHKNKIECDQAAALLQNADALKKDVCGDQVGLQDWRADIERAAGDISAIERFNKQDVSKAKELEYQRQKLKVEHDCMAERLNQLVSNLLAEERACDRLSNQVMEGMEQRKEMMMLWSATVDNLRNRDADIRHVREDYLVLEQEAHKLADKGAEQKTFCDQQRSNNDEAHRYNVSLEKRIADLRQGIGRLSEYNAGLGNKIKSLQRQSSAMRICCDTLRRENKQLVDDQRKKEEAIAALIAQVSELKEKLTDSLDQTQSAENRTRELRAVLKEDERYATSLTVTIDRAKHCSFIEQKKLLALKNDEKIYEMQIKAAKAIMNKLKVKEVDILRNLQIQKESLYTICYQLETTGARNMQMEGAQIERENSVETNEREDRLKEVMARHVARVEILECNTCKLQDDMRRLTQEVENFKIKHITAQNRLKYLTITISGTEKEVRTRRDAWRRERVEDSLLRLRVAHAARALAGSDDVAFTLDQQRLQLEAAMNERLVEISARRDIFMVQKRSLSEACCKLRTEIKEREQRIQQLIKRYEIFLSTLGKDEHGEQVSVTFFKIKFAEERAALRERGSALDAEVQRRERDVRALETTLRVVSAAHQYFVHQVVPLTDDTPEIQELRSLNEDFHEERSTLKKVRAQLTALEEIVNELGSRHAALQDQKRQLACRQEEAESAMENAQDHVMRHEQRLITAKDIIQHNAKRAKKLIDDVDQWRLFQMAAWTSDYMEAAGTALRTLVDVCDGPLRAQLITMLLANDVPTLLPSSQRRLLSYLGRIIAENTEPTKESIVDVQESLFTESVTSTTVSMQSGHTQRLKALRRKLAVKIDEEALVEDRDEQGKDGRLSVSLRVVSLGLDVAMDASTSGMLQKTKPKNKRFLV